MNGRRKSRNRGAEAGVAMLIAIFALLLISVIAIALIVSSGTESALGSNYRTSTSAYYAGLAGLEEARGRLLWRNPDFVNNTVPGFILPSGNPSVGLSQVLYILNPANGEVVDPTNLSNTNSYADNEYQLEFGIPITAATVKTINSVSGAGGMQGPLFKWVRITAATEKSLGMDVDADNLPNDATSVLYYDPLHSGMSGAIKPGLVTVSTPSAQQALEITALATIPVNTQKLLQYVVTPIGYGLYFQAPLVIPGSTVVSPTIAFQGAQSGTFQINGMDGSGAPPAIPGCTPGPAALTAVGVSDLVGGGSPNVNAVKNGIPATPPGMANNYLVQGSGTPTPSVQDLLMNAGMQTPASLNGIVQKITQYADTNINRNAIEADMPAAMSQTNPMTVVVNGSLTINSNFTGYGLLVVTGDLVANADFGWKGVVLVAGSGNVTLAGGGGGNNEIDGVFLVAHTMDTSVSPAVQLPALGLVNFNASTASGRGIYYNSCWINMALRPPTYQILSFREISLN
jgi:hypothetical protein